MHSSKFFFMDMVACISELTVHLRIRNIFVVKGMDTQKKVLQVGL